ncbi:GNAT family N-acetyltransferase [Massilia haematophila]|uniref:GNAT family N-acetyltransferase n=2 Tax=Massilia TaxID=149698 RepID=A0ABV7PJD2_9BURK
MSRHDPITLRSIREDDLDAVLRVQAACYPPVMQEAADVVRSRIRAAGATSFVAESGGVVCAYVFAYRSSKGAVTPLDAPFAVQEAGDTLYIHDLSVAPAAAGQGLARRLAERLQALAREQRMAHCALVSVQDSQRFWERLGFRAAACGDDAARLALASYPPVALYMCRSDG